MPKVEGRMCRMRQNASSKLGATSPRPSPPKAERGAVRALGIGQGLANSNANSAGPQEVGMSNVVF
jgi:hypothetical protein